MSDDRRIRVMIVEDHFMVRVGLAAILNSQPDMVTVAEATNGPEAIGGAKRNAAIVDVLLCSGIASIGVCRQARVSLIRIVQMLSRLGAYCRAQAAP